jgi:tetratricopeptide (TPR) repeat protein
VLYQRLLSLYATKDPQLLVEADRFLQASKDPKQKASVSLLKAEALFQKSDYAAAAKAYAPLVENASLKPEQRSAALYKLAWTLDASGDQAGAVRAYTAFAEKYPGDPLAATAVLQRGLAHQKTGSHDEALADFEEVINRFQFSKEVEIALLQKALTLGQQKKYPEMASAFQELLKRYPNSAASAQAHFWLGWAAFEKRIISRPFRCSTRPACSIPKLRGSCHAAYSACPIPTPEPRRCIPRGGPMQRRRHPPCRCCLDRPRLV